uniref:Polynucleotide adenylyltransferase n=3 Tax=Opuntia streptacantha TaxID=393608 RepID=A0A7C8ZC02_OPUST
MAGAVGTGIGIRLGIRLAGKSQLAFRAGLICRVTSTRVRRISSVSAVACPEAAAPLPATNTHPTPTAAVDGGGAGGHKPPDWKKLSSKDLRISTSMIDKPTRLVLKTLKKKGYQVYLVGGCVRDLILKRIPKDFDVITSAELKEVSRTFPRCEIVGKRFPICRVDVADCIVEVSSFSTVAKQSRSKLNNFTKKPQGCNEHDYIRWRNCVQRDFTINGLMFDPFSKIVYDYIGGIEDIKKSRVRTVIPASSSFTEDCARILRAVRIAARLGFSFTKETARSLKEFSSLVLTLDKGRILMEMNYMLAFGAAEASIRLLWKYGLLEILLPIQAAYFVSLGFRRRDKRSNLLLSLFANLDKLLAPDRPCHSSLWVSILAFHKALADQPRDPLVVATFCLAVHNGGCLSEAVCIAKIISQPYDSSFHEVLGPGNLLTDENVMDEVKDLADSVRTALSKMTDRAFVSQAMAKYPQAPHSDLVFISMALQERAEKIISCVTKGREKGFVPKRSNNINYESLAVGNLHEVRLMLSRVIFDTIYPPHLKNTNAKHANGRFT